jgi:hypothetical protein
MRYLAKPKMNNSRFDKEFNTEKEAVNYLEKETEFHMPAIDWKMINKLQEQTG